MPTFQPLLASHTGSWGQMSPGKCPAHHDGCKRRYNRPADCWISHTNRHQISNGSTTVSARLSTSPHQVAKRSQENLSRSTLRSLPHPCWHHRLPCTRCCTAPLRPTISLPPRLGRDSRCGSSLKCARPGLIRARSWCKETALPFR